MLCHLRAAWFYQLACQMFPSLVFDWGKNLGAATELLFTGLKDLQDSRFFLYSYCIGLWCFLDLKGICGPCWPTDASALVHPKTHSGNMLDVSHQGICYFIPAFSCVPNYVEGGVLFELLNYKNFHCSCQKKGWNFSMEFLFQITLILPLKYDQFYFAWVWPVL